MAKLTRIFYLLLLLSFASVPFTAQMLKTIVNDAPVASGSNISVVQNVDAAKTNSKAFGGAVSAGNTLVAIIGSNNLASNVSSCGDSVNGAASYTHAPNAPSSASFGGMSYVDVYYLIGTAAGTPTVTCPMSGSTVVNIGIIELSGVVAFDESAKSNDSATVGSVTTDQANEFLLVANGGVGGGDPGGACTGYAVLDSFNDTLNTNDQWVKAGAAGSYSASCPDTLMFFTVRWLGAFK